MHGGRVYPEEPTPSVRRPPGKHGHTVTTVSQAASTLPPRFPSQRRHGLHFPKVQSVSIASYQLVSASTIRAEARSLKQELCGVLAMQARALLSVASLHTGRPQLQLTTNAKAPS